MRYAEAVAKLVLEQIFIGATARYCDDERSGKHDFELECGGCPSIPIEVTMSTSEAIKRTTARLRNQREGGWFVPTRECGRDWLVEVTKTADIRCLRAKVDEYLARIERLGLKRFTISTEGAFHSEVLAIYEDLGVKVGRVCPFKPPGRIGILPPSPEGGRIDPIHVNEAVLEEANKPDNRLKLGATDAAERYLLVYVDLDSYLAWDAVIKQSPGATPLYLPSEISTAWVVAPTFEGEKFVVWKAVSGQPWESYGVVEVDKRRLQSLVSSRR